MYINNTHRRHVGDVTAANRRHVGVRDVTAADMLGDTIDIET